MKDVWGSERVKQDRRPRAHASTSSARRRASPARSGNRWIGWAIGGAALLFFLYSRRSSAAEATNGMPIALPPPGNTGPTQLTTVTPTGLPIQSGTQNIPELPGSSAISSDTVTASNNLWDSLQQVQSLGSGYINFPSGAQAAATLFPMRMDSVGNYYVQWAGITYMLGSQDSSGNWPAIAAS